MINCIVIDVGLDGVVQIKTIPQIEAALGFFAHVGLDLFDVAEFETKCGVGMEMTFSNDSMFVYLVWWSGSKFVPSNHKLYETRLNVYANRGQCLCVWTCILLVRIGCSILWRHLVFSIPKRKPVLSVFLNHSLVLYSATCQE